VKVLEQKCSGLALKYLSSKQREVLHLRPKPEYGKMFNPNPVVSTGVLQNNQIDLGLNTKVRAQAPELE